MVYDKIKESELKEFAKKKIEDGKVSVFAVSDVRTNNLMFAFRLDNPITVIDDNDFEKNLDKNDYIIFNDEKALSLYESNFILMYDKLYYPLYEIYNDIKEYLEIDIPTNELVLNNDNLINAEISKKDAKILKNILEREEIESIFAEHNGKIYAYIDKGDREKTEELINEINQLSKEEKTDIDKSISIICEKTLKRQEKRQKAIEKRKHVRQIERNSYLNYLKDKASGIEAMTDEELMGFKGEVDSYKGPSITDDSHINEQIYEENLSEIDNVHNSIKEECEERGLSYSAPGDIDARVDNTYDINEDEYSERTLI